jgi:hypothetical protein
VIDITPTITSKWYLSLLNKVPFKVLLIDKLRTTQKTKL